jgi:hypothetical protein
VDEHSQFGYIAPMQQPLRVGLALLSVGACSHAPSESERLQLQERCAAAAKVAFTQRREEWLADAGNRSEIRTHFEAPWYTNHYNLTKHKCYIEIREGISRNRQLYDVFGNKLVASLSSGIDPASGKHFTACIFPGHRCRGDADYDRLLKLYMED